jgi:chromosome segregation ATPase
VCAGLNDSKPSVDKFELDDSSRIYLSQQKDCEIEIESLKREVNLQEEEIDENLRQSEASQEELKAMISDLRRDLASCRAESWSLAQCSELAGYKSMLLSSIESNDDELAEAEEDPTSLAELEALNETIDAEFSVLMAKLGSVRSEMLELDEKRQQLAKELEEFDDYDASDSEPDIDGLRTLRQGDQLQRA